MSHWNQYQSWPKVGLSQKENGQGGCTMAVASGCSHFCAPSTLNTAAAASKTFCLYNLYNLLNHFPGNFAPWFCFFRNRLAPAKNALFMCGQETQSAFQRVPTIMTLWLDHQVARHMFSELWTKLMGKVKLAWAIIPCSGCTSKIHLWYIYIYI